MVTSLPRVHVAIDGHRAAGRRRWRIWIAVLQLLPHRDRTEADGLHVDRQRTAARRRRLRARGAARGAPGQRPLAAAGQRPGGNSRLHPLRCVHERMPGVPEHRRPRVRRRLSRSRRRGADAGPARAARLGRSPPASSLCGACRDVCPVRIDIPRMLLSLRAESTRLELTPAWATSGLRLLRRLAERRKPSASRRRLAARATRLLARGRLDPLAARASFRVDPAARLSGLRAENLSGAGSAGADDRRTLQRTLGDRSPGSPWHAPAVGKFASSWRVTSRQAAPADLVALHARMESLEVTVHHEADDRAATARVLALLDERGASRVMAWDPEWLNCRAFRKPLTPTASSASRAGFRRAPRNVAHGSPQSTM